MRKPLLSKIAGGVAPICWSDAARDTAGGVRIGHPAGPAGICNGNLGVDYPQMSDGIGPASRCNAFLGVSRLCEME